MKLPPDPIIVACNNPPIDTSKVNLALDYQNESPGRNLCLLLPPFVQDVYHLPNRILDLLELAAYIYAADRYSSRGSRTDLEYHSWTRSFQIHCKVRDYEFWAQDHIKNALVQALCFMSGDRAYDLVFYEGHATPPTNLFDREEFDLNPGKISVAVLPFSGGLDSLAGALAILSETDLKVCLVSHQPNPGSKRTQDSLAAALSERFPKRVAHYRFRCHLKKVHASEETQRIRSLLFSSIAFAIATAYGQNAIHVYENGITSMNFPRRQDQINARASRTTHPQTMYLLSSFFSLVSGSPFTICLPFLYKTKKDIFLQIRNGPHPDLIPSTVSCSSTYTYPRQATHCGMCLQCVDRRIAAFSAGADDYDHPGLYAKDIFSDPIDDPQSRTVALDYVRQAVGFYESTLNSFYATNLNDLADIIDYLPEKGDEWEKARQIWNLIHQHGLNVHEALSRIRDKYDDLYKPLGMGSLLHLLSTREHLRPEIERLVASLTDILRDAVPEMFRVEKPKNENDLNSKVGALLRTHENDLCSEHPSVSFACSHVVPDHSKIAANLYIESKYVRTNTPPSKVTDGIASDLTKYPAKIYILFVVYDPSHAIPNDNQFIYDLQSKGRCSVLILR